MPKKYQVNTGFIIQQLQDKTIIFSGERSAMLTLNDTAAYILKCIKKGWNDERIADELQKKYEIKKDYAKKDIEECIQILLDKELIRQMS